MAQAIPTEKISEQIIEQLDFEPELPCQGAHHSRGLSGHNPEEGASFMVSSQCCGPKLLQCASRVAAMRMASVLYCAKCNKEHPVSEYTFIPVAGRVTH